jgi:branched-chain amino acid transport system permease protein
MEQFEITLLNGLALAGLYFVVAAGFSLIFGVMRVVNMAHGSFFLMGGYLGWTIQSVTGSWLLALLGAAVGMAVTGVVVQQGLLRRHQGQDLTEALITIALSIIVADLLLAKYGGVSHQLHPPSPLQGSTRIPATSIHYSIYSLALAGIGIVIGLVLWLLLERTYLGTVLRAGIDDREMVAALGINIQRVFAGVFAVGTGLAGAAGVLGGTLLSLVPGTDSAYLVAALAVVIVGGMGSLGGSALGALVVGLVTEFGLGYFPQYAESLTVAAIALVLVVRPVGLLGRLQ